MKKKISVLRPVSLLLALLMLAVCFSACSGGVSKTESEESQSSEDEKLDTTIPDVTIPTVFSLESLVDMIPGGTIPQELIDLFPDFDWSFITALKSETFDGEVDEDTGNVTFDTTILFAFDSSTLTEKGKEDLKKFLDIYVPKVLSDKNKPQLNQIIVEGHTDTTGSHDYNQMLSEDRANAVVKYSVEQYPELKPYIVAKGYSYDYPIKNADGSVNMEKSRRVVFKVDAKKTSE